jgi:hypothetical protein
MPPLRIGVMFLLAIPWLLRGWAAEHPNASVSCPVTTSNPKIPTGQKRDALGTALWPGGKIEFVEGGPGIILPDGALSMKFPWWRGVPGKLTITGRRLDAPAAPLRARIPEGYANIGFQPAEIIFPTTGCWEVQGKVGDAILTFVTLVEKRARATLSLGGVSR